MYTLDANAIIYYLKGDTKTVSLLEDIFQFGIMVLVVAPGLLIAYTLNFMFGKYGWHKLLVVAGFSKSIEKAKRWIVLNYITSRKKNKE